MARHLQLPDNLNPDNPPRMAPQWLSDSHDSQAAINSALVDKPHGPGAKFTPWSSEDKNGQKEEKQERAWRAEDKPPEQRNWAPQDRFSQSQPERFVPQSRLRPAQPQEGPPAKPGFGPERWRNDGEGRWGHSNHADGTQAPWDQSPARGTPPQDGGLHADNWNRQRQQRLTPPGPGPARPDAGRWGSNHTWGSEEHYPPVPPRGNNWEVGVHGGRFNDPSTGLGRGKGFGNLGRGRGLAKEPLAPGSFVSGRWNPPPPPGEGPTEPTVTHTRLEDIIAPPLGTGPQKLKYTVEQMLSAYASVAERERPQMPHGVTDEDENLFSAETYHHLLGILDTLAREMITAFATPAERRLASRLHSLLERSQPHLVPEPEPEPKLASQGEREPPTAAPQPPASAAPEPTDPVTSALSGVSPFSMTASQNEAAPVATAPASQPPLPLAPKPEAEWFYQDPSNQIQGPYSQTSIQEWFDSGFFPLDLPVSSTRDPPRFRPLRHLLEEWKQPAQQPQPVAPAPAPAPAMNPQPSLSTRPSAMQSSHATVGTAGSARLDAAEAGVEAPQPGAFLRGAFPPDRPGSHPYLDPQLQHVQQLQAQQQGQQQRPDPSLQYGLPQDPFQRGLDHGRQLLNGIPQQQIQQRQGSQLLQAFVPQSSVPQPDPIVGPIGSVSMSRNGSAANLAPIGPGYSQRGTYNPPSASPQSYQPQMQSLGSHLPELLGQHGGGAFPLQAQRMSSHDPHLGMPYSAASYPDSPFPHALPGLPHQHLQQQQHQQKQQQQQQGSDRSIRPLGGSISLSHWIQSPNQVQNAPNSRGVEAQLAADVQSLGLLPSSNAPVGPPPRRVTPAPSTELPTNDDTTFQKVERSKRKEPQLQQQWQGSLEEEIARNNRQGMQPRKMVAPPPAPPRREEPEPLFETWHRPPTLAQAAGLREPAPLEAEHVMPWAVASSNSAQKSLLDIQREEAVQAKEMADREVAQAAATKSSASTLAPTSWGKQAHRIMPPAPAPVTSLTEIQEQERRQAARVQQQRQPPTAPPSAPVKQPTWGGGQAPRAVSLRSQQTPESSADLEGGPHRHSGSRKAAAAAPAQEPEDELFWDYGPPARHANGTAPTAAKQNGAKPAAVAVKPSPPAAPKAGAPLPEQVQSAVPEPETEMLLSPEFDLWCKAKLRDLRGDDDMTLMHFLMTVSSNAEVAEYMTEILGRTAAVSAFANEFIKRKLAEQSGKKGGGRSRKAAAAPASAAGKGAVGVAPVSAGGATGWTKLPKKKNKAKKVDAALLGFATGTDYSQLEKLQD